MELFSSKGRLASQLRQQKFALVRQYGFPADLVAGSLTDSQRRCGKSNCHCTRSLGHSQHVLRYRLEGERHAHHIPSSWGGCLDEVHARTKAYLAALEQLMLLNAQLLALDLEARKKKVRGSKRSSKKRSTPRCP